MKSIALFFVFASLLLTSEKSFAQHFSEMNVVVDTELKTLLVTQQLTFFNSSNDTLNAIVLNDWNNAYATKYTPLAKRFSDEFIRSFHLANENERGSTNEITILNDNNIALAWKRTEKYPDIIEVVLANQLLPNQKIILNLSYVVKVPSDKFTKYGFGSNGKMNLKNWFLAPARFENGAFAKYNNNNLDDCANAASDYKMKIIFPENLYLQTDLNVKSSETKNGFKVIDCEGQNRLDFSFHLNPIQEFYSYKNNVVEVCTDLQERKLSEIQKALIIDKIVHYVDDNIGRYSKPKITVSQIDYDRSPFYGLNQLPSFLSPFADEFLFEIKFLKTYLNTYLKNSLQLDLRKDNWIYDGIQVYTMMKYIDEHYPDSKMMGNVSKLRILKSYNLVNLDFNEQYSYFYMLMARKNLDQPLGDSKNTFIKFNEQIAGKYRSGLSLNYLDNYLENQVVTNSIQAFFTINQQRQTSRDDFELVLKSKSQKNIDWFFNTIINSRKIVDFKFNEVSKTKDSITFTIRNKTKTNVPISVYGLKNKTIVFKNWYENVVADSTFTIARKEANKIVLNYKNEVPEFNLRNNWSKFSGFSISNRPFKFVFMKDLEDPYYNQILYVPTVTYNLYDGISPGFRFHNKTILDKPFVFDINPAYSTKTQTLTGGFSFLVNQNYRNSSLYNVRYAFGGSHFHYAPNASYSRFNPSVALRFRPEDLRDNRKQLLLFRQVMVQREASIINIDDAISQNYNVFNIKYINTKTEVTKHFNVVGDFQASSKFGKVASEIQFRKLFIDNRQLNLRFYAGSFIYNKTETDFFSFALDRPTDYLFDYNYYGRSENTGLFSQQLIVSEGGFKSRLNTPFANQWITTLNGSYSVWNWIEIYGDLGFIKSKQQSANFVYDSGVRLNLVTDYFELYFPVYSNNGWEIAQKNYNEKIRFIVTIEPKILMSLFTRKWF